MRHGTANRRQRNRGNSPRRSNQQRTQVFDSNGPDVRIRGTAHQVCEKYLALAKDAQSAGDRILAESYYQHAEHYQRIINSWGDDVSESNSETVQQQDGRNRSGENHRQRPSSEPNGNGQSSDDLRLPASILGGAPLTSEQSESASEPAMSDME